MILFIGLFYFIPDYNMRLIYLLLHVILLNKFFFYKMLINQKIFINIYYISINYNNYLKIIIYKTS
jgi:hypothetical protein